MYAIIKTGGKQYRVSVGDLVQVELLGQDADTEVTFSEVLAVSGEDGLKVGKPVVEGASVKGTIVRIGRTDKVRIFKFRRRKHSMKSGGHRQYFAEVRIDAINA
ncbi:50S ribosomal protein L21 [Sutterella sp.]|uniref:50S ribosomal protein L21 n=1 Tax=Sutterella sp. TaxID=1981025 RepID=UPI0026E0AFF3|nr:50S ribosomal protein L21 [Sutterella sp.]MDO5530818.1 50S ribosomal protein L21 [Sutterella sp.]